MGFPTRTIANGFNSETVYAIKRVKRAFTKSNISIFLIESAYTVLNGSLISGFSEGALSLLTVSELEPSFRHLPIGNRFNFRVKVQVGLIQQSSPTPSIYFILNGSESISREEKLRFHFFYIFFFSFRITAGYFREIGDNYR